MQSFAVALLATPVVALKEIRFAKLSDELDKLQNETRSNLQVDRQECSAQHSISGDLIAANTAKKQNLEDGLSQALADVAHFGGQVELLTARDSELQVQLSDVEADTHIVEKQFSMVSSRAKAVISDLDNAIANGQDVCVKLRKQLNKPNDAVSKVCDGLLDNMNKQLQTHRSALTEAENNKKAISETLSQQKDSATKELESVQVDTSKASADEASADEKSVKLKDQLVQTEEVLRAATAELDRSEKTCESRQAELEKFLNGLQTFEGFLEPLKAGVAGSSLFQSNVIGSSKRNAMAALQKSGSSQGSSPVVQKITALLSESGPFDKVIAVINNAISSLESQIAEHISKSQRCVKGLAENEAARDKHSSAVQTERTAFEKLNGQAGQLMATITHHQGIVTDCTKNLANVTRQRELSRAHNQGVIEEYTAATSAVEKGKSALESSGVTASTAGPLFSAIDMIQIDLRQILEQTTKAETELSSSFAAEKERLEKQVVDSTAEIESSKMDRQQRVQERDIARKKHTSLKQLLATDIQEFEGLQSECLSTGEDFQARNQKRAEELQSLQQALAALADR